VELLLNRREIHGVTRYLVRWRGHSSADDEWLRAVTEQRRIQPAKHACIPNTEITPPQSS
jgi:retron-type reverse transcriptase